MLVHTGLSWVAIPAVSDDVKPRISNWQGNHYQLDSPMVLERPLVGEPLGLDLLNTRWLDRGVPQDVLGDLAGTRRWLDQTGPAGLAALAGTATERTRQALHTAREAIGTHIDQPRSPSARAALNEVLAWGRSWPVLGPDGPDTAIALDEPAACAGWLAAVNYLELLTADPTRVRRCAHPECVLHFYDTSPKRSRRWCSMAGCGNRAKAARHYAKAKASQVPDLCPAP